MTRCAQFTNNVMLWNISKKIYLNTHVDSIPHGHISLCVVVIGLVSLKERMEPLKQGVVDTKPQGRSTTGGIS